MNKSKQCKKFSVLLLYPDYIANTFGQETYYAFVQACSPKQAVEAAQAKVCLENESPTDEGEDFFPLLVLEGHQWGLDPDEE